MTEEQMKGLRRSIQKFGYLTPVVIDQDNKIADGEHRAITYKEMGYTEIPAIKMRLETDADRRQLRQVLNKLHGSHDKPKDADELVLLLQSQKLDELAELIAQPAQDLRRAINRYHPGIVFAGQEQENMDALDALVEEELNKKEPHTTLGDVYALGEHRLICGDCTQATTMQRLFNDNATVAQLNCDPPYGVDYGEKNKYLNQYDKGRRLQTRFSNDEPKRDYTDVFCRIFDNIPFSEYNTIYIWSGGYKLHEIRQAMTQSHISWGHYLIWVKNNHVLGRRDYHAKHEFVIYGWKKRHRFYGSHSCTTVLEYDLPQSNGLHPTMKPIELIKQTITDGTKEGDIVLDTFAGAASSLIASEQTNRQWRGIELDPWYCDVIVKRWEKYTGKEAQRLTS